MRGIFLLLLHYPVQDVLAQYQALQSDFKELHKALDKATGKRVGCRVYACCVSMPTTLPPRCSWRYEGVLARRTAPGDLTTGGRAWAAVREDCAGGTLWACLHAPISSVTPPWSLLQLKRRTADMGGAEFPALLAATSQLRREQEEESRHQERMHEQRMSLQV